MRLGYWVGMGLGVMMVGAFALTSEAPLRAASPQGAVAAQAAAQVRSVLPAEAAAAPAHRFVAPPMRRAVGRALLPSQGAAFLSMVAGDAAVGAPPVAAVREAGKLRLVQPGDTLDGAVVASIAADALTLRAGDNTVVLPRAR